MAAAAMRTQVQQVKCNDGQLVFRAMHSRRSRLRGEHTNKYHERRQGT